MRYVLSATWSASGSLKIRQRLPANQSKRKLRDQRKLKTFRSLPRSIAAIHCRDFDDTARLLTTDESRMRWSDHAGIVHLDYARAALAACYASVAWRRLQPART